jgi:transcriptional regulator with XRE-family HTH domain
MNMLRTLWQKLATSKKYREEFVAAQLKRGIPFQIQTLMKQKQFSQDKLAKESGLTQGVISRAANPDYGNLTLNTIIKIAAGFDVAFVGKFVPFSELGKWFTNLTEESVRVKSFEEEDAEMSRFFLGRAEDAIKKKINKSSQAGSTRDDEMGSVLEQGNRGLASSAG